ncbi:hypothetical protein QWY86_00290 [Pedobacter aquatilis]|uniref:hypothetical protein n=1 Tax=Pedobacter aquatilis TaxID=351343 RepID=UPI0025B576B4|nr:hypothetical protein [Pedobacter aquatilis]MDN3585087.1 hypothetical protein [Pedobacter aquatilis]
MKIICTLSLSLLFLSSFAQKSDSTRVRKSTNSYGLIEKSVELKSKPHIKEGSAEVFLHNKLIATGLYKNNERIGRWRFFNGDSISQLYNYNSKKIEYNVPDTTLTYNIDSLKEGDKLLYPVKIGSMNDLYWYLASTARIPDELKQINGEYQLIFILNINKLGKISKLVVDYRLGNNSKSYELVDQTHRYKDFDFVPAIVNDKAVNSQMLLKGRATIGY